MTAGQEPRSLPTIVELLSHDTTSTRSNRGLTRLIADRLDACGVPVIRQQSPDGSKENLLVTIPDANGGTDGGVLLAGHLDTVPVDGQAWTHAPFAPQVRQGRLYARGAADMKGFCGSVLAQLPTFLVRPLAVPLKVAFTYDEETGCAGARHLLELLTNDGPLPEVCLVGEPTSMRVIVGHKGCLRYRLTVHGRSTHSSLAPAGVNAVAQAGRLVAFLADLSDQLPIEGPFNDHFTVPHTTVSVGPISGGTEPNIVPDLCEVQFEIRPIPGHDVGLVEQAIRSHLADLERSMRLVDPDTSTVLERVVDVPALKPGISTRALAFLDGLVEHASDGALVSYGTEAGIYQRAGIDTVVCGPGSIAQAHIADEYIELDQIGQCDEFLDRLRDRLHTPLTQ